MKTLNQWQAAFEGAGLGAYFAAMAPFARPRISIKLHPCTEAPLGASRLGGLPDLPRDTDWFRRELAGGDSIPLSFLGQINMEQVRPCDTGGLLPERGILYLFYDCDPEDGMPWGFDPQDGAGKRVFFYEGDMALLERKSPPEDIADYGKVFPAATLTFEAGVDMPDVFSSYDALVPLEEKDEDAYFSMMEALEDDAPRNKLLGHSDNMQDEMESECEYISRGYSTCSPEEYADLPRESLNRDCLRWKLLLQLDSNEELDMMWGDDGRLYLFIPEEELKKGSFEHTWLILQCG